MSVLHLEGGGNVCTYVKNNIIKLKDQYESIGLLGFDYKLFEEYEGGGVQKELDRYPCLKH